MKKIMALTAVTSVLALFVLTSQVAAQTEGTLTADPATVPAAGQHSFTVTGSGFNAGTSVNVLPCTLPGAELTPDSTQAEIDAAADRMNPFADCDLANLTPANVDGSGNFSAQVSAQVGTNFAWAAGDAARTQSGLVLVFIVAPAEEPAEEEAAEEEDMDDDMDDMADEDMDDMGDEDMDDMGDEDMDDMADEDMDDMGDDMADEDMDDMGDDMADEDMDDMGDDMVPEGPAATGFGGSAGSDGNSVAVPLAATLAAVVLLGGAVLVTRRNA